MRRLLLEQPGQSYATAGPKNDLPTAISIVDSVVARESRQVLRGDLRAKTIQRPEFGLRQPSHGAGLHNRTQPPKVDRFKLMVAIFVN